MAANILIFLSYVGMTEDARLINQFYFDYSCHSRAHLGRGCIETLVTSMFLHGGLDASGRQRAVSVDLRRQSRR